MREHVQAERNRLSVVDARKKFDFVSNISRIMAEMVFLRSRKKENCLEHASFFSLF